MSGRRPRPVKGGQKGVGSSKPHSRMTVEQLVAARMRKLGELSAERAALMRKLSAKRLTPKEMARLKTLDALFAIIY